MVAWVSFASVFAMLESKVIMGSQNARSPIVSTLRPNKCHPEVMAVKARSLGLANNLVSELFNCLAIVQKGAKRTSRAPTADLRDFSNGV